VELYDRCGLEFEDIDLPKIDKVYTSTLNRAKRSAEYLGFDYEECRLFNEVETRSFFSTSVRFPIFIWLSVGRVLWSLNLLESENRKDTLNRAKNGALFLDEVDSNRILVVTHGYYMRVLAKELEKRGYTGEIDKAPKNARLYCFKKVNI
jgi:broad specificity phosphatase PhoE